MYKELIERLRKDARVIGSSGKGWGEFARTNRDAANAIEQLCEACAVAYNELANVFETLDRVERERDAAVADIKQGWTCCVCKKRIKGREWCNCEERHFRKDAEGVIYCDRFEWRGVQEVDNVREKLAKLLTDAWEYAEEACAKKGCRTCPKAEDPADECLTSLAVDYFIDHGVTVQEWIPVTERLPVTTCLNLAMTRHGITVIAYFDGNVWRYSETLSVVDATHWMPLPSAPKQEG